MLFVKEDSIVRKIWGAGDYILFIFAGSAAEFALNKAVDWLYFTGRLPADPIGRLFSTVSYSKQIIFSSEEGALAAIEKINNIHAGVERGRHQQIPDWAYRDVLFMLIDYSIKSFELLSHPLTIAEKEEVFEVFYRVGKHMQLKDLPLNYNQWLKMRNEHLQNDLQCSKYTVDLYRQYKKSLGLVRFFILKQVQIMIVPAFVRKMLGLSNIAVLQPFFYIYKFTRKIFIGKFFKSALLPVKYKTQIQALDVAK